jgi:hypothetical protein
MPERVRLLERDDPETEALRQVRAARREEQIDLRSREGLAEREREGNGEEGVPDPVVGPHHQDAAEVLPIGKAAFER